MPNVALHVTEAAVPQIHVFVGVQVKSYQRGAFYHILLPFFDIITSENPNAYLTAALT